MKRILIATGIFEPESGGPATYTPKIAAKLVEAGWKVSVITYSDKASYDFDAQYPFTLVRVVRAKGKLKNYFNFFFAVMRQARGADLIYTLDWLAAGLPVSLVARLRRIPYVVRIGGDYAWEQKYLESGQKPMPLLDFYERGIYRNYRVITAIVRFVIRGSCKTIFNTIIERELYVKYLHIPARLVTTIFNPVPRLLWSDIVRGTPTTELVSAGRMVVMKNTDTLIRAFKKAKLPESYTLLIIGDGPQAAAAKQLVSELGLASRVTFLPGMRQKEMYERVKDCRAMVLTSWTDISPNQVYEALALHIPMLVTKENYLSVRDQIPSMIDPSSEDDIAKKFEMLTESARYDAFCREFDAISFDHSWDDVLAEHLTVFKSCLG